LHELAYLQHFDFAAAEAMRQSLGLPEKYTLVRLIAHDALHDQDIHGLSEADLERLIEKVGRLGEVRITSQAPLPPRFASYALKVPIEAMHAVLAGAELFIGESPTMAVESSLLGVPAFLVSERVQRLGNMIALGKAGMLRNFMSWSDAERELPTASDSAGLKSTWSERARAFRTSQPDMAQFLIHTLGDEARRGKR